ncbi:unnamed protein product [Sympodiomycopsis kandeliae]
MSDSEHDSQRRKESSLPGSFQLKYGYTPVAQDQATETVRRSSRKRSLPFQSVLKASNSVKHNNDAKPHAPERQSLSPTTPAPPSSSPVKRKRRAKESKNTIFPSELYPDVSDHLYPSDPTRRLDILICGLNPGLRSSQKGLHFAHPSNHFYRTLHLGNLTPIIEKPEDCALLVDQQLPFPSIGLTNICARPTREGSQLNKDDFCSGTPILNYKIATQVKPFLTVFTGKGIGSEWEKNTSTHDTISLEIPKAIPWAKDGGLGLMSYVFDLHPNATTVDLWRYSFLFLVTSPSGRVTTMHLPEKGQWMGKARECWQFLFDNQKQTTVKQEEREEEDVKGFVQPNDREESPQFYVDMTYGGIKSEEGSDSSHRDGKLKHVKDEQDGEDEGLVWREFQVIKLPEVHEDDKKG